MNPKPRLLALVLGLAAPLLTGPPAAAAEPLAGALEAVVKQQIAAFNAKNLPAAMATVHTKSPEYAPTEDELAGLFKDENLTSALVSFHYTGHDDEFAVARVKVKVSAPSGAAFVDNVSDTMMLFHQENGAWRIWGDYQIGVQTLEPLP